MKKIYTLFVTVLTIAVFSPVFAQYTATKTGTWSNAVTWAPGVKPSATCNNCIITINSGITVTLDAAVVLTGTSQLILSDNAKIVISASSNSPLAAHHSITLVFANPGPTIVLATASASIDATAGGTFDGIFNSFGGGLVTTKLVGKGSSIFVGGISIPGSPAPALGQTLTGPGTLNSAGTLPVVLVDFNASLSDGAVDISWTTEAEINADHFNIQRSTDGTSWHTIGTVAARGNSESAVNYSFTDKSPAASVNYYRLQSVDKDANFTYSEIKAVRGTLIKGYSIFPNPARDNVYVTLSDAATSEITIRLINQRGQVLQQKILSNAGGTTVSLPVRNYAAGAYLLQVSTADGTQQTKKLIINHQ